MFIKSSMATLQLPTYFDKPLRYTHNMHPLSFRQIHTAASYYQCSFYSASEVLWNRFPSEVVPEDLDSLRKGVRKINHQSPSIQYTVFNLFYTNTISFYQASLLHFLHPTIFLLTLALTVQLYFILKRGCCIMDR